MALFERTSVSEQPRLSLPVVPQCWLCKLDKGCKSPKMPPTGQGKRDVLVIGEAPGEDEDKRNRQFVGKTGVFLRDVLKECGLSPDRDCVFENAVRCRPPNNKLADLRMVGYCRPNVTKTIEEYEPKVIILLGAKPLKSVLEPLVGEDPKGIRRWAGFQIPCQRPNAWICPTYHPSYVLREERSPNYPVLLRMFKRHIRTAVRLKDRPWKKVPDYKSQVSVELDAKKAANRIRTMMAFGKPVAFDFETTTLKPDGRHAAIYTCGVSDGKTAIAYPWLGEAITATKELLKSKVKKVGFNLKFEDRWCRVKLGFHVRNFEHCGMITAHGLDCRPGTKSAKFQAMILLGQGGYSTHIKPYFQTKDDGGNSPNRIHEAPLEDLLIYNCLDAMLEYKIWAVQQYQLGLVSYERTVGLCPELQGVLQSIRPR